jgi:hypothetical protein
MLCIRVLSLEVNLGTLLFTAFWKIRFASGIFCNECPEPFISSTSTNPILALPNKLWKNKITIIIAASIGIAITVVVVALLAIQQQQQIQLPEQQQVLEQPENNLTFPQANISSSNSSNDTMPLEQSELVVSEPAENTTTIVDEVKQVENESQEDVMMGHLEEDLAEKSAESSP